MTVVGIVMPSHDGCGYCDAIIWQCSTCIHTVCTLSLYHTYYTYLYASVPVYRNLQYEIVESTAVKNENVPYRHPAKELNDLFHQLARGEVVEIPKSVLM